MADWRGKIVVDPDIMFGKPVIAGTRIPVENILRKLAQGRSVDDIITIDYPQLTKDQVLATIAYASDVVAMERVVPIDSDK